MTFVTKQAGFCVAARLATCGMQSYSGPAGGTVSVSPTNVNEFTFCKLPCDGREKHMLLLCFINVDGCADK